MKCASTTLALAVQIII